MENKIKIKMLRFFACTAILAVVSAQLSPAEQQALADAQALIDKLDAAKDLDAAVQAAGPSIDTLDGNIIIGVGPSNTVSMNVGGNSAVSVSTAAATNSAKSFVEMKIGTAAIKVRAPGPRPRLILLKTNLLLQPVLFCYLRELRQCATKAN